jgi:hypothetical protein
MYAVQASRGETKSFLPNNVGVRMPREINAISERFVTSIVHHNQFPPVVPQFLVSECIDTPAEVVAPRIVAADDDGERHS